MSWLPAADARANGHVSLVVEPSSKDLGGFRVRRALPSVQRRMVGPFVFLDHMGPVIWQPGQGLDVRPHPHIGLATLTYLTEGEIFHRDSLGTALAIRPGEVNWMTAGRGIAHSERTEAGLRASGHALQGIQSWLALPKAHEETAPGFAHHAADDLPSISDRGVSLRLVVGSLFGQTSPVATFSETFYADVSLAAGASMPLPPEHPERAAYVLSGALEVAGGGVPGASTSGVQPRGRHHPPRHAGQPRAAARGRAARWAAASLVELRIQLAGADRGGEGGLEGGAVRGGAGG